MIDAIIRVILALLALILLDVISMCILVWRMDHGQKDKRHNSKSDQDND